MENDTLYRVNPHPADFRKGLPIGNGTIVRYKAGFRDSGLKEWLVFDERTGKRIKAFWSKNAAIYWAKNHYGTWRRLQDQKEREWKERYEKIRFREIASEFDRMKKDENMDIKTRKALTLLERAGYSVSRIDEAANKTVEEIKKKCDEFEELRGTEEGDGLWDELVGEYGYDLLELAYSEYDNIKAGKPVDMTAYLERADGLYPEFFELLEKCGVRKFKIDTGRAFRGNAAYFYEMLMEGKVKLCPDDFKVSEPAVAYLEVER
jgi:hypothetical protein